MKLAIVGSRTFTDYILLEQIILANYDVNSIEQIISGGAIGTDTLAEKFGDKYKIPKTIFKPDWNLHGRSAGLIRNDLIIESADEVIAFWDGISKGTLYSINFAKKNNKKTIVYNFKQSLAP